MSNLRRKLLNSSHRKYGSSRLNGRCESVNGSQYYSCAETDSCTSDSDDDNRERSQTLYHSLSWEFVPPAVNVESNPSTADSQGSQYAGHSRSEHHGGHSWSEHHGGHSWSENHSGHSWSDRHGGHSTLSYENFVDPISTLSKCIFILCLCLISVGDYFCLDNPVPLHDHILQDLDISELQYTRLYSITQWTIIASSFLGGFLIDRLIGARVGIIIFATTLTISQVMFASGAYMNSYWTMFAARLLYGITRAPLGIIVNKLNVKWFGTGYLHAVFGLEKSIGQISNFVNIYTMSVLYNGISTYKQGCECLGLTLFTGVGVCLVSLVSASFVAIMDRRADRVRSIGRHVSTENSVITASRSCPLSYWLIVLTTSTYYIGVFLFVSLGKIYFEKKYGLNPQYADAVNGMVYLLSALTLPMFGFVIDRLGRSIVWVYMGLAFSLMGHIILTFTFIHPFVATVTLGLGFSVLAATIWPMVTYVIGFNHLGTAFGIMTSVQYITEVCITYLTDYILDHHGYFVVEIVFSVCMLIAVFLGILLDYADHVEDGYLNLKASERKKYV